LQKFEIVEELHSCSEIRRPVNVIVIVTDFFDFVYKMYITVYFNNVLDC